MVNTWGFFCSLLLALILAVLMLIAIAVLDVGRQFQQLRQHVDEVTSRLGI